jgi:hypothetical protein
MERQSNVKKILIVVAIDPPWRKTLLVIDWDIAAASLDWNP